MASCSAFVNVYCAQTPVRARTGRVFPKNPLCLLVRYLVKAKIKAGKTRPLLNAVDSETLGQGSIAGDEYIYNMTEARVNEEGVATWVETCFCDPPLAEERPYWEEYFELLNVKDAHSRRNCRHENGTEPWACCDCDCTQKLGEKLRSSGKSFLQNLRQQDRQSQQQ
jgi:hypothetical protein